MLSSLAVLRTVRNGVLATVGLGIATTLNEQQGWQTVKGSGVQVWGNIRGKFA